MSQCKQVFDGFKQHADLADNHHQYHNQPGQRRHHGLLFPAGADEKLVEHRHNDADGGYFEHKINVHEGKVPFFFLVSAGPGRCHGLRGVFIKIDGDQIIYNPEILAPEFERSGYNSVWTDEETDEWLQTVENGIVTACSRMGGKSGWQLYSISRWTAEDGKKLKRHLEIEFEQKKNRQIYWDDVAMFCYPEEYQLGIRPMNKDDIIEVDNLSELIALDASYKKYEEGK